MSEIATYKLQKHVLDMCALLTKQMKWSKCSVNVWISHLRTINNSYRIIMRFELIHFIVREKSNWIQTLLKLRDTDQYKTTWTTAKYKMLALRKYRTKLISICECSIYNCKRKTFNTAWYFNGEHLKPICATGKTPLVNNNATSEPPNLVSFEVFSFSDLSLFLQVFGNGSISNEKTLHLQPVQTLKR